MHHQRLLAGAVAFALSFPALAAEPSADLERVTVTGTRTEQPLSQSLAPVILIDRDTILQSQAANVAELLQFQPGIDIGRNGGVGQTTSVFIRGTESNHTLVLVDGVKINPGTIGIPALQNIALEDVERIEIVKGPRSALYGSDAIGGVINIITRKNGAPTASLRAGHYGTREFSGAIGTHSESSDFRVAVDRSIVDGYAIRADSPVVRGSDDTDVKLTAGHDFDGAHVTLRHWQSQGTSEYLDFFLNPVSQSFDNRSTALSAHFDSEDTWAHTVTLSHILDDIQQDQSGDFNRTSRDALDWQVSGALDDEQTLTAGLYAASEQADAESFGSGFDETTHITAGYAEDLYQHGPHQLAAALRLTHYNTFGSHVSDNLDYGYALTPDTRVSAGFGQAFRAPDATDRFGFGGNPGLQPETSRNLELGLRHRLDARQVLQIQAYQDDIRDLIEFVDPDGFGGPDPGANQNIARARVRGLELSYRLVTGDWGLDTTAVLQQPRDLENDEDLARRSRRQLTVHLTRTSGKLALGAQLALHGPAKDSPFSADVNAGYGLLDVTASWDFGHGLTLGARLDNLLDRDYQTAAGYRNPGRGLYVSLRYSGE